MAVEGLAYAQCEESGGRPLGESGKRGELRLVEEIRRRAGRSAAGFAGGGLRLGIGDDCALLEVRAGEEMAVTTDLSIAGRHFRLDWHPAEAVGHRALARGLSDLAAMGARPVGAFLSLGLPEELTRARGKGAAWVTRFFDGLLALAETAKVPLAGGDLAESPIAVADIVLVGAVRRGRALLRRGAGAGDGLYVTGALGGAAAGLACLAGLGGRRAGQVPKRLEAVLRPHLYPQPRIAQGLWLAGHGLGTAAMDLSDGLSTDLAHLCEESGVAAEVEARALPIAAGATLDQALNGGEDYELLFTAAEGAKVPRRIGGVKVTRIGRMVKAGRGRAQVTLVAEKGREALAAGGWEHFA